MNTNLTDITIVVDRSGSMDSIKSDAEGGVNSFIAEQAKESGEALVTLLQFDTKYEFLYQGTPIQEVPQYELVPRGMTALLDAVGRAVNETSERLAEMAEKDRPGLVIFVIMTDGLENSSKEFTKDQIKEMIERQQKEHDWHFTFLGANQDAFAEAGGMGINKVGSANYRMDKVGKALEGTSRKVARMRAQRSAGEAVKNEFTDEEREKML
jgi:hypothetical protein